MKRRIFIRLLNRAGYDLRKKDIAQKLCDSGEISQTSGWRVEFIGAYGVGKTTLFHAIWPQYEHEWYSRKQLRRHVEDQRIKLFNLPDPRFTPHFEKLLVLKFRNLIQSEWPMPNKVELYDFFKTQLGLDLYFSYSKLARGLFSDDGIIHNFAAELTEMMQDDADDLKLDAFLTHLFKKRALIYLKADPKIIEERLKIRSGEEPGACNDWITYWHSYCSINNITGCIVRVVNRVEQLLSVAEKRGAAVLRLDEKNGITQNDREISGFLEGLKISEINRYHLIR